MTCLPDPPSRQDRQRQTRQALLVAAREVFARDGFHGASLDLIAREAGFSKGAIYSNFEGKTALFLAVMDLNLDIALAEGGWDVFEHAEMTTEDSEVVEAMAGFALATLEFVATAGRDEHLAAELGKRMQVVISTYGAAANESRAADEWLSEDELGALLTALDQGAALLALAGSVAIDQRILRAGMQRLLNPARVVEQGDHGHDGDDGQQTTALHPQVVQRRIAAAMTEQHE